MDIDDGVRAKSTCNSWKIKYQPVFAFKYFRYYLYLLIKSELASH